MGIQAQLPHRKTYDRLRAADPASLSAQELEALADAAWWLSRLDESIEARQHAYSAYARANDNLRAGYTAWFLFYDYLSKGEGAAASGWLGRARRHLDDEPECLEQGYLLVAEADAAQMAGDPSAATEFAERAIELSRRVKSPDLSALALQALGRILIGADDPRRGIALLDEAMISVLAGELSPFITGWVYCNVLGTCLEIGDLRRAGEWTAAATAWCESLPEGSPYHGLCRLYRVEVVSLKGEWPEAERDALRATEQLTSFPGAAGHAFYALGEIRRRRGHLREAEEAFKRAHELGRDPHPGLALVRLSQGRVESAIAALRTALDREEWTTLSRAALLSALVEATLAADDVGAARDAAEELSSIASNATSALLDATAAMARGVVGLADDDAGALRDLHKASTIWHELELPYEAARTRVLVGRAARQHGDHELAELELEAARAAFERLGAVDDVRIVKKLLDRDRLPGGLTEREIEVLRLVASGKSNRDIARDLVISERTVARHLQNIYAKLDISSRAAATAFAFEHELI